MQAGSGMGRGVGVGLLAALALLLAPAFASAAAPEHEFLETFGSAAQPTFPDLTGNAEDQATGDFYVVDNGASA